MKKRYLAFVMVLVLCITSNVALAGSCGFFQPNYSYNGKTGDYTAIGRCDSVTSVYGHVEWEATGGEVSIRYDIYRVVAGEKQKMYEKTTTSEEKEQTFTYSTSNLYTFTYVDFIFYADGHDVHHDTAYAQ